MSIELVKPSNHLILCHPLLLPLVFPSIRVLSNESVLHIRLPKYWSFNFSISPSNEYSGLISFRMDLLDLLVVQGTLKSLLQHHSLKASILQCSAFFMVQLSHPYMTTGKTIPLTRWTFVGLVMSLLFNMLSRFVIAFLPRSKRLLISWVQSPSAGILEPPKIKSLIVSIVSPSICHKVMGLDAMILVFWMFSFKPLFHSPFSLSSRGSLVLLHLGHTKPDLLLELRQGKLPFLQVPWILTGNMKSQQMWFLIEKDWCRERLRAEGEGRNRRWGGCMASPTQRTCVWANSRRWWRTQEAWHLAVFAVTKSWSQLSDWTTATFKNEEKANGCWIDYQLVNYKS